MGTRSARRPVRRRESKFPIWGVLALPGGLLWGALLGVLTGGFLGNPAMGVAVGAGLGIGVGIWLFAAAIVVASAKEVPSPGTGRMDESERRDG